MFEKLRAFVGDNAEALKLIDTIEGNSSENVQKINDLETKVAAVTETRDRYKSGNALVKSILGVDTVNEDTIKEAIKSLKGGKQDDTSKAELEKLQDLLKAAEVEKSTLKSEYEGKLNTMALDNALANAGVGAKVANEAMYKVVTGLVREGAVFEDGKIVYKAEDGTTVYGNDKTPLTLSGKIEQLKSDPSYAGLFIPDVNSGTGTPPGGGDGADKKVETLSPTEMMKSGRK